MRQAEARASEFWVLKNWLSILIESLDSLDAVRMDDRPPVRFHHDRHGLLCRFPGVMFEGESVQRSNEGIEGFNLALRRADQVIAVSVLTMVLMLSLALSILLMSLRALTSEDKIELLPLSLCVSLLFGLPALRNAQPAVPPLGVLGDYISFIWAEMLVAVSAIMIIWTWLIRQRRPAG